MSRVLLLVVLLVIATLPTGCADDDPATPKTFAVNVSVVDQDGAPVPDLLVSVTSNNDFLQDAFSKAAVAIPFTVLQAAHGQMTIEDIDGETVAHILDDDLSAGWHLINWNGQDDARVHQPSGHYTARIRLYVIGTDSLLYEGTAPMLMCLLDAAKAPVGVTDGNGKVALTDKRTFPHLYDPPPMPATNENSEITGELALTDEMIFTLGDTTSHTTMFVVTEVGGATDLEFLWAPRGLPVPTLAKPLRPTPGSEVPEPEYEIGPVYPNPFN